MRCVPGSTDLLLLQAAKHIVHLVSEQEYNWNLDPISIRCDHPSENITPKRDEMVAKAYFVSFDPLWAQANFG